MTEETTYYPTVAAAEQVLLDEGYVRNKQRAVWVNFAGKTAKVMRGENGKFYVERS